MLDGEDVLARSAPGALSLLCCACGIAFDEAMLRWPAGPRPSDGVWAPAWYDQVERSTAFGPPRRASLVPISLDDRLQPIAEPARPSTSGLRGHPAVANGAADVTQARRRRP